MRNIRRLERDVFPWLGDKAIASISPPELLNIISAVDVHDKILTLSNQDSFDPVCG